MGATVGGCQPVRLDPAYVRNGWKADACLVNRRSLQVERAPFVDKPQISGRLKLHRHSLPEDLESGLLKHHGAVVAPSFRSHRAFQADAQFVAIARPTGKVKIVAPQKSFCGRLRRADVDASILTFVDHYGSLATELQPKTLGGMPVYSFDEPTPSEIVTRHYWTRFLLHRSSWGCSQGRCADTSGPVMAAEG